MKINICSRLFVLGFAINSFLNLASGSPWVFEIDGIVPLRVKMTDEDRERYANEKTLEVSFLGNAKRIWAEDHEKIQREIIKETLIELSKQTNIKNVNADQAADKVEKKLLKYYVEKFILLYCKLHQDCLKKEAEQEIAEAKSHEMYNKLTALTCADSCVIL